MSTEEDPYRRLEPAPRGDPESDDGPLQVSNSRGEYHSGPTGLGGWLILVAIGVCLSPIRLIGMFIATYGPALREGRLLVMFDDNTHLSVKVLLWFECIFNPLILVTSLVTVCLFFTCSRWFPRVFIGLALATVAGQAIDLALAAAIPGADADLTGQEIVPLIRASIFAAIWVPYMLVSQRVRNTFGTPRHDTVRERREPVF